MAIINASLDVSEQKEVKEIRMDLLTTGATFAGVQVPWPCEVRDVYVTARRLSGAPTVELERYTFAGGLTINSGVMAAQIVPAFGTSGAFRASLAAQGSTLVQLASGDLLVLVGAGTNAAADDLCVSVVLQKLQDTVADFGVSS